jgi:hypothetical protein
MDRLETKDWRLLLVCAAVIAVSGVTTATLFRRAFPEAAIEFRINRDGARRIGEAFLNERGRDVARDRFAGRFDVADTPKVYLERTLGLEKASALYGRKAKIWLWEMRWFRSGVKEEEQVAVSPLGDLVSWDSVRREDAPGARLSQEAARAAADRFLDSRGLPASVRKPIEATPVARPNRTDWTFVDERRGLTMGEATVRYSTTVMGGEVGAFREFVHVPEEWVRGYERLRSKNEAAGAADTVALFVTLIAMIAVLVTKITRKDVRWRLVAAFGGTGFVLALLSALNELPLGLFSYDTSSPLESHVAKELVLAFFGALGTAAFVALVVAAAEPIYRERFPRQPSLAGTFSRRGIRTKRFFLAIVMGYALTAFFFAYQALFYVVADRLGAWAPAEVPFDNMLNTAFPWATVLFVGFLPAVSEEGISRMFSISFLDRLGAGRLIAVVVPAFIWGFGHSTYPNQPFYIRGIEVGCAGVLIGALMLRYGVVPLLVWHFTVDATYTALLMLRSGNTYYVVSGAVAAGILLAPLAVCAGLALARRGFEPETGLTNADEGFVPPPVAPPAAPQAVAPVTPVPRGRLLGSAAAALALAAAFLLPSPPLSQVADDHIGRARAQELARDFVRANGGSPERYRIVSYTATGFAEDEAMRDIEPGELGQFVAFSSRAARYVLREGGPVAFRKLAAEQLPLALWAVRFVQPEKKEEWKVLVDARRGRVVAYANPAEEGAAGGTPPTAESARERALSAAGKLGYPAADYLLLELGTKVRPKRTDTTVVLEAHPAGIGQARPRLTAVFHGKMLSAFYPSIHIPEDFLREEEKRTPFDWLLLGARVMAAGAFFGVALIVFLRIVREPDFRWRSIAAPLAAVALFGAVVVANGIPSILRAYSSAVPLGLFEATAAASLLIFWIGILLAAAVLFVLLAGARPGWRRAMRAGGSLWDAFARAAISAAGLFGLSRWAAVATARFPALDVPDPSLPSALEKAVPGLSALTSAAFGTSLLAASVAVLAMAARDPFFRKPAMRVAALLAVLIVLLPSRFHSPAELLLDFLPAAAAVAWLLGVAFLLLKDDVASWVLFGAIAFGGRACLSLLSQSAPADQAAGWVGAALLAVTAVALVAGRRPQPGPGAGPPLALGSDAADATLESGGPRP